LNRGLIQQDGRKIGLGYPPIFAVESLTLAGRDKNYSGAGDLANADAMTNTKKATAARAVLSLSAMTSQYCMLLHRLDAKIDLRAMKRKRSKRKAVREDRPMGLSRREAQVVELMGKGLSRAEISDRLGVSRKCVSAFIERARKKLRLKTSLQLRHLGFRLAMFAEKTKTR